MHISRLSDSGGDRICPAAFMLKGNKVLLGHRHYTGGLAPSSLWTVPGGRGEDGETVEATLRREVAEETGIREFEILAYLQDIPGATSGDIVPIFLCTTKEDATLMEPEKFSEWRWVPLHEFAAGTPSPFINPGARTIVTEFISVFTR